MEVKLDFQNLPDFEKLSVLLNDLCRLTAKFVKSAQVILKDSTVSTRVSMNLLPVCSC